jgi:hypothetical protein
MAGKRKRGRRVDAKGRSIGDARHVRLYRWELESPAYRSLSVGARALLVELKSLYNGDNNGALFLSVRRAAARMNCSKTFAAKMFAELQDRGFIRLKQPGGFNVKSGDGRATTWVLNEYAYAEALATKDFMRWRPPENSERGPCDRTDRPTTRTLGEETDETVPPRGRFEPKIASSRSHHADTDNLPSGVKITTSEARESRAEPCVAQREANAR